MSRDPYTFVCAATVPDAHAWCARNGVRPRSGSTRILTPKNSLGGRGCALTTGDRVVVLGDVNWENARLTLAPAGLGTVVHPEFVA